MSILAKAITTTGPSAEVAGPLVLLFLVMIAAAPIVAWRVGVFRRGSVRGPERIGGDMPLAPIVVVTLFAGAVWMIAQVAYVMTRSAEFRQSHPNETFDTTQLSAQDFAFLSTVPFAIGLAIFIVGDAALGRQIARRIGYSIRNLIPGIGKAAVAMLIVLPIMWVGSFGLEMFYRLIHYEHPAEHELLGAMKDAPMHARVLLVIGACVAAPVFEELLFRGHVQTILVRLFTPALRRKLPLLAEVSPGESADALPLPLLGPIQAEYYDPLPTPVPLTWIAVVITSLIFAGFHPLWMAPLIFLLSICLGYAYERTGNLWVNIAMHAIFNASSTLIFLNFT